jgi:hypothetical protein
LPSPIRFSQRDTVDSAIPKSSAISAPVSRNRRSLRIASTRSGAVRLGTSRGADERSPIAAIPPSRKRRTHLAAVRSLTPAAAAAAASDQRRSNTLRAINALLFGQVLALA